MEDIVALGFTSILKNLMVPIIIIAALPPKYEEGAIIPITFFFASIFMLCFDGTTFRGGYFL